MLEKEKYYRYKLFKKIFLITFIIINFSIQPIISSPNKKIINNLIQTNSLSFSFKQIIDDKIEVGKCYIKYPKLIYCLYDNKDKKEIVSNGRALVIKNNRYNKTYIYPLKTTPLEYILDKEFILNKIKNLNAKVNDNTIEFLIDTNKKLISVFFNNKTFNLAGWKIIDIYQKEVIFQINNLEKNVNIDENRFKLPSLN